MSTSATGLEITACVSSRNNLAFTCPLGGRWELSTPITVLCQLYYIMLIVWAAPISYQYLQLSDLSLPLWGMELDWWICFSLSFRCVYCGSGFCKTAFLDFHSMHYGQVIAYCKPFWCSHFNRTKSACCMVAFTCMSFTRKTSNHWMLNEQHYRWMPRVLGLQRTQATQDPQHFLNSSGFVSIGWPIK